MEAIGLFQAKTHLSELVARAEAGEEVIIMRHNKPVARIVPMQAINADQPQFDTEKRHRAVEAILKLRKELKEQAVRVTPAEIAQWRRSDREERAARQWLNATKPRKAGK